MTRQEPPPARLTRATVAAWAQAIGYALVIEPRTAYPRYQLYRTDGDWRVPAVTGDTLAAVVAKVTR